MEPQWEGRQGCRIFLNEITPRTPPPPTPPRPPSSFSPHTKCVPLIGRGSQSLTSAKLSCGRVPRKSVHSAHRKRSGEIEEERQKEVGMRTELRDRQKLGDWSFSKTRAASPRLHPFFSWIWSEESTDYIQLLRTTFLKGKRHHLVHQ